MSAAAAGATIWLTSGDAVSQGEATSPAQETTAAATANVSPEHVPFTTCGENCTHSQPPAAP